MKVSIIICLYNTKRELFWKTLDSIYTSTLEDFEVVVVDDGSTVDYSDLIEKYHPVYAKTENRGHLAARLYGLMLASSKYVCFVDSDDTVSFNYHKPMVTKAEKTDADIVINDWAFKTESFRGYSKTDVTIASDISLQGDDILKLYASNEGRQHSLFVLWNKLFKRELLLKAKSEIEKTDVIMKKCTYSEDMLITFFAFKYAKKLENVHTGYYFYHVHDGQSVTVNGSEKLKTQIELITANFAIMRNNVGNNKYASQILESLRKWELLMSRTHYSYAVGCKDASLNELISKSYNVDKLKKSKYKDSSDYIATGLLGDNFEIVDKELKKIYKISKPVDVFYDKNDKYVASSIEYLCQNEDKQIAYSKDAKIVIPKQNIKLRTKILHNRAIYSLGTMVFKKGSKAREFLKKHF